MNDETLKKAAKIIIPVLVFVLIVFLIVHTGNKKEENENTGGNGMGEKAAQIAAQAQKNAAANGAGTGGADATGNGNTGLANPYVTVTRASDFESTGIAIDAPSGSTSIKYMILSETIPVVDFKKGAREYHLEATKGDEQLSVIYGTEEKSEMIDDTTFAMLTSYVDQGTRITWQKDGVNYFLTCHDAGSAEDAKAVYELLK